MTVYEAYKAFILDKSVENCSGETITNYKNMLGYFVSFVGENTEVNEIQDTSYIKGYILHLQKKNRSGRTIHTYLKHIKVFYRWLVNNGHIEYNNVSDLRVRFERKIPDILNTDEILDLMNIDNLRDKIIVMIVLDCGIRKNELVNLNVSDIRKDSIFVHGGKGKKDRIVPLSYSMYKMIQEYIESRKEQTEYLFQHYFSSERLNYAGVHDVFRRLKRQTGIKRLHAHLCRHTYGTYFIYNGGSEKALQMVLGHAEIETTEVYVHLAELLEIGKQSEFSIINKIGNKKNG